MAENTSGSRRAFVVGGVAVAALSVPLALARRGEVTTSFWSPRKPVPQSATEVRAWEALVGGNFALTGEQGAGVARLVAIESEAADPKRPAYLARSRSFSAVFEADAARAPIGQNSYSVRHPTKGLIDLFLSRGTDRGGKAVLTALFN